MKCLERYISTHIHFLSWRTLAILQETYVIGVRELEGSNEGHDAMPLKHAVTWLAVLAHRPRSQAFFLAIILWRLHIIPGKSNTNKRSTAAYIMMPMFFGVRELPFHSNVDLVAVPVNSESPDLDGLWWIWRACMWFFWRHGLICNVRAQVQFLESRGHLQAVELLRQVPKAQDPHELLGEDKVGGSYPCCAQKSFRISTE